MSPCRACHATCSCSCCALCSCSCFCCVCFCLCSCSCCPAYHTLTSACKAQRTAQQYKRRAQESLSRSHAPSDTHIQSAYMHAVTALLAGHLAMFDLYGIKQTEHIAQFAETPTAKQKHNTAQHTACTAHHTANPPAVSVALVPIVPAPVCPVPISVPIPVPISVPVALR